MAIRDFCLAIFGWGVLAAFIACCVTGRGKSAADYAEALKALSSDMTLAYDDHDHAIWSGWWTPSAGSRLTNAANPDVIFRAKGARDCSIELAAFPLAYNERHPQVAYLGLNGHAPVGPVVIASDGAFRFAHTGDLVEGVNRLTLRLPNARKTQPRDERAQALGVRSIALACDGGAARQSPGR